jgi:diguanylate cyclase (GGDEF)-like protein
MRKNRDEAATRILRPLFAILKKELKLDRSSDGVRADGNPLDDMERQLVNEVFELLDLANENDARLRALEERVSALQLQNLELVGENNYLSDLTAHDSLTGLYNRRYVMDKIDSEMNRAVRHGHPMSVLMLDLDHFKRINDSFGHPAGDQVLKSVGQVLKESCRVYDVPGRYGGEEFCIVLPDTRVVGTTTVAERIRMRLENTPQQMGEHSVVVTASIGIAVMDSVADEGLLTANALLERADRALYSAKHHGRNRVELWAPNSATSGSAAETSH